MCVCIRGEKKEVFFSPHFPKYIPFFSNCWILSPSVSWFYVKLSSQFSLVRARILVARDASPQTEKNALFIPKFYLCVWIPHVPLLESHQSLQCQIESHMTRIKPFWKLIAYKIASIFSPCRSPNMNVQILDIFLLLLFLHKRIYHFSICVNVFIEKVNIQWNKI